MSLLSKLTEEVRFSSDVPDEDKAIIRNQIMCDNRRFVIIWASAESAYWIFDLIMSMYKHDFYLCRNAYAGALIICLAALLISLLFAGNNHKLVPLTAIMTEIALLGAGIGIACYQDARTIVLFAAVLIIPVMYVSRTVMTAVLFVINTIVFAIIGSRVMSPEPYSWSFLNLIIFSTVGLLIGHFVDTSRFERYVYARSVEKLADIQKRYAYYDQMTGLKNRRAYAEHLESLAGDLQQDLCIVMADINGLKTANDTIGHEAGDELIINAADCLQQAFSCTDNVYRIGGDEFCVIMKGSIEDAQQCIDRLEEISAKKKGRYIECVSISSGAESSEGHDDIETVVQEADRKMYESKNKYYITSGKDRRKQML
jgi:diguanylate cyclase (GGDEF)-like protein